MKLSRILVAFFLFTGLVACKQGREQPPIPEEQMQQVLVDMHLAETYSLGLGDSVNRFEKNYDSLAGFYTSILNHHNLSFAEFNEALTWYKERPLRIDTLYSKVLNQLTEIKASAGISDIEQERKALETASGKQDSTKPGPVDTLGRGMFRKHVKGDTTLKDKVSKPVTQSEP